MLFLLKNDYGVLKKTFLCIFLKPVRCEIKLLNFSACLTFMKLFVIFCLMIWRIWSV